MIQNASTLARRSLRNALGTALATLLGIGLLAAQADGVAVCQKTNKHGKSTFKLRDACRTDKGEVEVSLGTRTVVYHTSTDSQEAISGAGNLLPIDGDSTTLLFDTTAASSDVVITFTAGCHTKDDSGLGFLDVDLVLDGTAVAPSDLARNGFCIVVGATPEEVEQTNSYTVAVDNVAAGPHSVQVLASNASVSPNAFLGDVSLVVTVHEK
jgi:hypothetical protein